MFFINSEKLLEKGVQSLSLDLVNLYNSHISFIFPVPFIVGLLSKLFFFFPLRGPGGRGPWPGPNANSVSLKPSAHTQ